MLNIIKRTILTSAALTVFLLTGCGTPSIVSPADTYTIEKQDLINSINVSGSVKGTDLVNITSTIGTPITSLNVELGDYVKKGDILCTFDSTALQEEYDNLEKSINQNNDMQKNNHEINQRNLQNAIDEKESSLQQAQRAVDEAKDTRDNAYNKYSVLEAKLSDAVCRRDDLYNQLMNFNEESCNVTAYETGVEECDDGTENNSSDKHLNLSDSTVKYYDSLAAAYAAAVEECKIAEAERDSLGEQLSSFDSAVKSAEEAYDSIVRTCETAVQSCQDTINMEKYSKDDSASIQLGKLKEQIENCVIKAPMDGLVTALNVAEGNIPTTDSIMTIEDDSTLKISATVREADIFSIETGMKVLVRTTATKDKEFVGEVTKVVKIYSPATFEGYTEKEGGYTVEITAVDAKGLYIGMNAKADIILDEKKQVFAVPYDSIVQDENDESVIYVAREQDNGIYKAESLKVTPRMETDYFIEIESNDIKEGDIVVTSPEYMTDGAEFTVRSGGIQINE